MQKQRPYLFSLTYIFNVASQPDLGTVQALGRRSQLASWLMALQDNGCGYNSSLAIIVSYLYLAYYYIQIARMQNPPGPPSIFVMDCIWYISNFVFITNPCVHYIYYVLLYRLITNTAESSALQCSSYLRRTCAQRVTVVCHSVCLSVCRIHLLTQTSQSLFSLAHLVTQTSRLVRIATRSVKTKA